MVAGKVKAAMGFQKSPASPKPETTPKHHHPCSGSAPKLAPSKTVNITRSFGVYFPRSSQVQPRPPDVIELVRLVEELQERESRLKTELLQHKIYRESVSIVPILEKEISCKQAEVEALLPKIELLEAENESLRLEVVTLKEKSAMQGTESAGGKSQGPAVDAENERLRQELQTLKLQMVNKDNETSKRMSEMVNQIEELKRAVDEANRGVPSAADDANRGVSRVQTPPFQGLSNVSVQPNPVHDTKESLKQPEIRNPENPSSSSVTSPESTGDEIQKQISTNPQSADKEDEQNHHQVPDNAEVPFRETPRGPRVPKPPPKPSSAPSSLSSSPESNAAAPKSRVCIQKTKLPALPSFPSPPPPPALSGKGMPPPPPPPPPARATAAPSATKVRRIPEVVEFYHSLMRRETKRDSTGNSQDVPSAASTRNMIGEIENRSAHLLAVSRLHYIHESATESSP